MNILVIGNGFDLAHGLPTKYTDFLFYCKMILKIIELSNIESLIPKNKQDYENWLNESSKISLIDSHKLIDIFNKEYLTGITERDKEIYGAMLYDYFISSFLSGKYHPRLFKEIIYLICNNIWIRFFLQSDMHGRENWIDFESEISEVIQLFDKEMHSHSENDIFREAITDYNMEWLNKRGRKDIIAIQSFIGNLSEEVTFKEIRNRFLNDLNKLIRAFEIYLTEYVEKINIKVISPDIKEIAAISYEERGEKGIIFSKVLSFNYTNIYEKAYLNKYKIINRDYIDYIHGKADINNTIESNNMVLGIDEYLSEERRDKEIEFIAFKKYFQRIYKGTGCKYKEWVQEIQQGYNLLAKNEVEILDMFRKAYDKEDIQSMWLWYLSSLNNSQKKKEKNNLYIFGHSLDITDKDVLGELILNDNVHTTIYYPDKNELGRKIANLVKVIGQTELIRRTGGTTKTIEFVLQKPMENKMQ